MASAQQKPKTNKGERNPNRRNGKAPKKHPKKNDVSTDIVKREELRAKKAHEARVKAEAEAARQAAYINRKHAEALLMHKQFIAEAERQRSAEMLRKLIPSLKR